MFTNGNDKSQLASWIPNKDGTNMLQNMVRAKVYSGDGMIEDKLVKYQLFWNYYNNKHWAKNNDKLLSFNYVRAIIDKVNNFMVSEDGFELVVSDTYGSQVTPELSSAYEAMLNYNWGQNKKKQLLKKLLQMGGITGDVYVFLSLNTEIGYVEYRLMDTRTCIPVFENGDYNTIVGYKIVQPLLQNEKNYVQKVYLYTASSTEIFYVKDTGDEAQRFEAETYGNSYGFIPIVHIENIPMADSFGGRSDVEDIVKINKVYNEMTEDIKMTIDYYAQPTTVITGGTVGQLKRGINQIWSGLPSDANVFNLGLGEDLSASMNFLTLLKQSMHDLSGVPEEVLSKVQHISNTSASALQMMYQSLIQVANIKAVTYGEGIRDINIMTLIIYATHLNEHPLFQAVAETATKESIFPDGVFKPKLFANRFVTIPKFKYALPNDRLQMLNEAGLELSNKIASRREIMERLGKPNIAVILNQIEEDMEFAKKYEESKEPVPEPPNKNGGEQPHQKPTVKE